MYSGELMRGRCVVLLVEKMQAEDLVMLCGMVILDDGNQGSYHGIPPSFEDAKLLVQDAPIAQ